MTQYAQFHLQPEAQPTMRFSFIEEKPFCAMSQKHQVTLKGK